MCICENRKDTGYVKIFDIYKFYKSKQGKKFR